VLDGDGPLGRNDSLCCMLGLGDIGLYDDAAFFGGTGGGTDDRLEARS
jgi:hypothetical protein